MRWAPPGLVFAGLTLAVAALALTLRGRHDAPAIAPIPPEAAILADVTLVDAMALKTPPKDPLRLVRGVATSISDAGVWLTASSVVRNCHAPMVMATPTRGLPARLVTMDPAGAAVLATSVGAPALPIADQPLSDDGGAFHPGYPRQSPGEIASRKIGGVHGAMGWRDAYAEIGRTEGLTGAYGGGLVAIAGTPVIDEAGRIVGVTLAEEPRRGRLFALPLPAVRQMVQRARITPTQNAEGRPVTVDNYGIVSDGLRRAASVAAVVCLDPSPVSAMASFSALPGSGRR